MISDGSCAAVSEPVRNIEGEISLEVGSLLAFISGSTL